MAIAAERVRSLADEVIQVGARMQFLEEQLALEKQSVLQQKELMRTQEKRIADLEALVKKRPPSEDETITVLKELEDGLKKARENHERRKRRYTRFAPESPEPQTTTENQPTNVAAQ